MEQAISSCKTPSHVKCAGGGVYAVYIVKLKLVIMWMTFWHIINRAQRDRHGATDRLYSSGMKILFIKYSGCVLTDFFLSFGRFTLSRTPLDRADSSANKSWKENTTCSLILTGRRDLYICLFGLRDKSSLSAREDSLMDPGGAWAFCPNIADPLLKFSTHLSRRLHAFKSETHKSYLYVTLWTTVWVIHPLDEDKQEEG